MRDDLFTKEQTEAVKCFKNGTKNWQEQIYNAFRKDIREVLHNYGIHETVLEEGVARVISNLNILNYKGNFSKLLFETTTGVAKEMYSNPQLRKGRAPFLSIAGAALALLFGIVLSIKATDYKTYSSGVAFNIKGSTVNIKEDNTKAKIKKSSNKTTIELKRGTIEVDHSEGNILVETQTIETYPIGTRFAVKNDGTNNQVFVLEGKVEVYIKKTKERRIVSENETLTVNVSEPNKVFKIEETSVPTENPLIPQDGLTNIYEQNPVSKKNKNPTSLSDETISSTQEFPAPEELEFLVGGEDKNNKKQMENKTLTEK